MTKIIVGIDPGSQGGLAVLGPKKGQKRIMRLPNDPFFLFWTVDELFFESGGEIEVVIESQWTRPGAQTKSSHTMLVNYGKLIQTVQAHGQEPMLVSPQTWKKEMGVTADKETSIALAKQLWPDINLFPTSKSRVECDGLAEAYLIAEYGRRVLGWKI